MIFEKPGYKNTQNVLEIVKTNAILNKIETVVIASSSGETAFKAIEAFGLNAKVQCNEIVERKDRGQTREASDNIIRGQAQAASPIRKLVVVTHVAGFEAPDAIEMDPDVRFRLEKAGAVVVTAAHSLGGIGRAARIKFGTYGTDELIAHALRLFGEGTKVAVEISMMATDAGAISSQELVIAIGGSSSGADTALILQPANTHRFFDLRIDEILCKPAVSKAWFKTLNDAAISADAGAEASR